MVRPFVAICLLGLAPGIGAGIELEYDHDVQFAAYATYGWHPGTQAARESVQKHIVATVDSGLQASGLKREDEQPDLWVVTHVLVDHHTLAELSDEAYWEFITGVREVDAYNVGAGTLVIDLVDARTQDLIWRAVTTGAVKGDVQQVTRKLDRVVRKMLKKYPPR